MRPRRFACFSLAAAVSFAAFLPAAADTARPGGLLTAKRIVCKAVASRACTADGACKSGRVPSSELVLDFGAGTFAEGRDRDPRGVIQNDSIENRVRKFSAVPSDRPNAGDRVEFTLDEAGALTAAWRERGNSLTLQARCTAL